MNYIKLSLLYVGIFFFCQQQIDAVKIAPVLAGAALATQLAGSNAHEYSITNNMNVPVGVEYALRNNLMDAITQLNRVALEYNCHDDEQGQEQCSYRNLRVSLVKEVAPAFATSIEPHATLKIYTIGYTLDGMKAQELHEDVSASQYPYCWNCYKEDNIGDAVDPWDLKKYRTFEINEDSSNKPQSLSIERHFRPKNNQEDQEDQNSSDQEL